MSNEWFFATSNERILQRVRSDFLQRATSATSNERILQRVTSDFTTSEFQQVTSNEWKVTPRYFHGFKLPHCFPLILENLSYSPYDGNV